MMPPPQDCPQWVNKEARQMMWLSRDRNLELSSQSAVYFFSKTKISFPTILFYPSAIYDCTQACQCKLVLTTLRRPDRPISIEVGIPHKEASVGSTHWEESRAPWWIRASTGKWISGVLFHSRQEWITKHSQGWQRRSSLLSGAQLWASLVDKPDLSWLRHRIERTKYN